MGSYNITCTTTTFQCNSPNYYFNRFGKAIASSISIRNIRYFLYLQFDIKLIEILLFLKIQNVIIVHASNLSSIPSLIKLETNSFIINKMNLPTIPIKLSYNFTLNIVIHNIEIFICLICRFMYKLLYFIVLILSYHAYMQPLMLIANCILGLQ